MSDNRITADCQNAQEAAELLRNGGLVAFPTETVYGLGADATDATAVAGIFEAKRRPAFDPLIVHVPDIDSAQNLVLQFPEIAKKLAAAFWPGPLTLVLPKGPRIPDLVTSGLPGVGIRIPNHPLALELLHAVNCPLAAPSANPFGGISPTTAAHVFAGLRGRIDGILDGGPCGIGVESTVISLLEEQPTILRHGGLPREDVEAVIGPVVVAKSDPDRDDAAQPAPGMLSRHYAPGRPLLVISADAEAYAVPDQRCGLLTYGEKDDHDHRSQFDKVRVLCPQGNLRTCAANFFAGLRSLDETGVDVIIARSFPNEGLGVALNDRLRRAANE